MYVKYVRKFVAIRMHSMIAVGDARRALADLLNRAKYRFERIVINRRGKGLAAVVSMRDLRLLEMIEEVSDLADAKKLLEAVRQGREKTFAWEDVKAELQEQGKGRKSRR